MTSVQIMSPRATAINIPPPVTNFIPRESSAGRKLRVPRSIQLQLARSVTFGVLGDDSQLYPSSQWRSENRDNFTGKKPEEPRAKPDFVVTSLDTRKHNPHPTQIFHIRRINKKPVCTVQTLICTDEEQTPNRPDPSVYKTSYAEREATPFHIVHKNDKAAEGIIPVNVSGSHFDVRSEMMLPVCDSTGLPSAHNPHKYLLRKRKVPPPWNAFPTNRRQNASNGIVYPGLEHARMTSYTADGTQTGSMPYPNEMGHPEPNVPMDIKERFSISSMSGQTFTRKRFIQPPPSHIFTDPRPESPVCLTKMAGMKFSRRRFINHPQGEINLGFDGGVPETASNKFDDKYLPFIRAKTII